jgi:ActR/RegA family two-component response regulator
VDEAIRAYMVSLGRLRWERMTDAQKEAHIRRMVAGQRKARLHRKAKKRGATK